MYPAVAFARASSDRRGQRAGRPTVVKILATEFTPTHRRRAGARDDRYVCEGEYTLRRAAPPCCDGAGGEAEERERGVWSNHPDFNTPPGCRQTSLSILCQGSESILFCQ